MLEIMAALMLVPTLDVAVRDVRVGDLVRTGSGRRVTAAAASRVVLRLPAAGSVAWIPVASVMALIRRQAPDLVPVAPSGLATILIRRHAAPQGGGGCWSSARRLRAGAIIAADDLVAGRCDRNPFGRVGYDWRSGAVTARAEMPAGAALGRLAILPGRRIAAGEPLTLRSVTGPVAVEVPVTTLQPARSGRSVFVRDARGQVFAAPLLLEAAR